jgi:hypothetical protein
MSSNIQYIDLQRYQEGGSFVEGLQFYYSCNSEKISNYLNILNNGTPITQDDINNLYEFYFKQTGNYGLSVDMERINNKINSLQKLNIYIKKYLGKKSKIELDKQIPIELFSSKENGKEDYKTLCNLYQNYYEYIQSIESINTLLCKIG